MNIPLQHPHCWGCEKPVTAAEQRAVIDLWRFTMGWGEERGGFCLVCAQAWVDAIRPARG